FMATMKSKDIALNRKMLAEIAKDDIESFKRIMQTVNK
ncbi:MAG: hypothetical protein UV60_C0004G0082, partial [Parcubacteria group bacterium GW2011_GWA2_43_11]